jgi:hypothetical protein
MADRNHSKFVAVRDANVQTMPRILSRTSSTGTEGHQWKRSSKSDRITDRNYVNVTLGNVRQVDSTHHNKRGQMEEQFTRRWMITLRVLEVDDHKQDNQKPLQDLFYRREKSIQTKLI